MARAKLLADAADIALELAPPKMKLLYESLKGAALHAQLGFDKIANLGSVESGLFAYWNETKGPHVTKFWAQVAAHKLPFTPR